MRTARCSCGSVEIEAFGTPMTSVVCYCDSCQKGSRQIEALTKAVPILDPDGGTAYILYRKDRITYSKGAELLKGYKVEEKSATSRVVATCCNSAMVMRFDDAKHWVPIYRARFQGDLPPLQWRICTKFKPANARSRRIFQVPRCTPPDLCGSCWPQNSQCCLTDSFSLAAAPG